MRAVLLIIDSFGIGEMPDAGRYGDSGANTALHICEQVPGAKWTNLQRLGLGNASMILGNKLPGCGAVEMPAASFGVMAERSPGKDTTTGHWELTGVVLKKAFPTFPPEYPSFPKSLLSEFEDRISRQTLGNCAASGTAIIQELGEEHLRTGSPIVYTSGDSVFQIAAHEEIIPIDQLYEMCDIARELCDPYQVARVIARPFVGSAEGFTRTERRKDFSMPPPHPTLLNHLQEGDVETIGIGKIGDIFCEQGLDVSHHDKGNTACLNRTSEVLDNKSEKSTFIFVNLVDTDMTYGHRRDPEGYCRAVEEIDGYLPKIINQLDDEDILIVSADHGCDPTFKGTDHTREYVPLLWFSKSEPSNSLGVREQFCDVTQTLCTR
ncbi:MAG: phosphopentomutase, partial [Spirochaetales bacterium]|nr:phosphopentomutase [Spirochaetales bacterium]